MANDSDITSDCPRIINLQDAYCPVAGLLEMGGPADERALLQPHRYEATG